MRKSKHLILSSFYFDFNDSLTEIENVKKLFKNQNILDLFRFDNLKNIKEEQFLLYSLDFVYFPSNIFSI